MVRCSCQGIMYLRGENLQSQFLHTIIIIDSIDPHILYNTILWGTCSINKLSERQKFATKSLVVVLTSSRHEFDEIENHGGLPLLPGLIGSCQPASTMQRVPDPCWTCRNRRIQCDQSGMPCGKCEKAGLECLAKRPFRWVKGVAIRGKMQGRSYENRDDRASAKSKCALMRALHRQNKMNYNGRFRVA